MGNQLVRPVSARELANALGLRLNGSDRIFDRVVPLASGGNGALSFTSVIPDARPTDGGVLIAPAASSPGEQTIIESDRPRLAFARALNWLDTHPGFTRPHQPAKIHPEARISPTAVIGRGVSIGKGTIVGHFVVIGDGVQVGEYCTIKSGAIIGENGFGFERDEDGIPIRIPHLGRVLIGNRVEIGSLNTVCKGALDDTIVEDAVKTDDHVHIAHNCHIRRGALLTAGVVLSGGAEIGEFAWLGPNSSVIQKATVGRHAFVGIGSNVIKPVAPETTVAGNPARVLNGSF